jgi:MFS family permease
MTISHGTTTVPPEVRRARTATLAILFANGLATTSWIVHLPSIVRKTGINEVQIGLAVSSVGIGSIIFIAVMGWVVSRFGARVAAAVALGLFGLAFPSIALSTSFWTFAISLFIAGAGSAMVEVAGSTSGSRLEHAYKRPMMPSFIGAMGVGMVVGSLVGAWSLSMDFPMLGHLTAVGLVVWAVALFAVPRLLAAHVDQTVGKKVRHWPKFSWRLAAVSVVILASVIEGSALAFSTLYFVRDLGTTEAFAAFSVTAYTIGTAAAQLSGNRLRMHFSQARLVRVSVLLGGAVLVASILVGNPWFALLGFAAVGAGTAFVYPAGISASADTQPTPAPGVAWAQTIRYIGSFGASPLVGAMIAGIGLGSTFIVTVAFGIVITMVFGGALGHVKGLGKREGGELPEIPETPLPGTGDPRNPTPGMPETVADIDLASAPKR